MIFKSDMLTLYAITDRKSFSDKEIALQVALAIQGGATMIQLREKNISNEILVEIASKLVTTCHKYRVPLIINDNWEVAVMSGADGVHVGCNDTSVSEIRQKTNKNFIIGATAKTIQQAKKAELDGADYLGVGAVFPSSTKPNAIRIEKETVKTICKSVKIPVVLIGGITQKNILQLSGLGGQGVALVSEIFSAPDIQQTCKNLKILSEQIINYK